MLTAVILTTIFIASMLLLASGLWATPWPWAYFVRHDWAKDDDDDFS